MMMKKDDDVDQSPDRMREMMTITTAAPHADSSFEGSLAAPVLRASRIALSRASVRRTTRQVTRCAATVAVDLAG